MLGFGVVSVKPWWESNSTWREDDRDPVNATLRCFDEVAGTAQSFLVRSPVAMLIAECYVG